ncbi:unnamed protein product [Darwinula stevensoni]|uniref:Peptidase S1 domain-containing protein n=1 Tax=Darwinula stevensoni TaxID=69355 RepID=A0A7R8XEE7_9CRUS|nr:unnamed protein product [Darwinula stevensoni]CAG0895229.1 unnamed protein product [Darwinula stevensoni]
MTESNGSGHSSAPQEIPNCDPAFGLCMATHLSDECRASGLTDFTELFRCPENLLCCASKTAIEKRDIEVFSSGDVASMTSEPVTYSASIVEHRTCHERITQGGLLPVNSICVTFSSTWCGESGAPLICKDSFSGFYRLAGHLSTPVWGCQEEQAPGIFVSATSPSSVDFYEITFEIGIIHPGNGTASNGIPDEEIDERHGYSMTVPLEYRKKITQFHFEF